MGVSFSYNPFTNNLDKSGSGGSGGNVTLTTDDGSPITSANFALKGQKSNLTQIMETHNVGGNLTFENRAWETPYIIDTNTTIGLQGTYSSIQAALNAAVIDGMTYTNPKKFILRNNTYAEDLIIPGGAYFYNGVIPADTSQFIQPLSIIGAHVLDSIGTLYSQGINWICASGDLFSGGSTIGLILSKDSIYTNTTVGAIFNISGSFGVNCQNCKFFGNVGATRQITLNSPSSYFTSCDLGGVGFTCSSSGTPRFRDCQCIGETLLNGAQIYAIDTDFQGLANASCITQTTGSGGVLVRCGFTNNGNFYGVDGQSNGQWYMVNCYAQTNLGSMKDLVSPTTVVSTVWSTFGNILPRIQTAINYTFTGGENYVGITDTSAPRSIVLRPGFTDYQAYIVDESGGASTNNITLTVAGGGLINGVSSLVINQNYGAYLLHQINSTDFVAISASNQGGGSVTLNLDLGTSITGTTFSVEGQTAYAAAPCQVMKTVNDSSIAKIVNATYLTPYIVDTETTLGLEGTFTSLQAAVNAAVANGAVVSGGLMRTIIVRASQLNENVTIPALAFLNITGLAANGATTQNTSDVDILGDVIVSDTALVYWENICFYTQTGTDSVTVGQPYSCAFTNCTFVDGSNSSLLTTGTTNVINMSGCIFLGKIKSNGPTDQSGQNGTIRDTTFLSTSELSGYAAFNFVNCTMPSIQCDDHAVANLINCYAPYNGSSRIIIGTSEATMIISNFTGRTAGSSSSPSPMFSFPGKAIISGIQNFIINDAWPLNSLTDGTTEIVMMPGTKGSITSSVTVTANYVLNSWDQFVWVNQSAACTITLNANCCADQEVTIKDKSFTAATNNITLVVGGGGTIEGLSSLLLNNNGAAVALKSDGIGNYFII